MSAEKVAVCPNRTVGIIVNMRIMFFNVSSFKMPYNGLQLGEVADLEALTFNLALNFIRKPNVKFSTEPAILPNCCYAFALLFSVCFVYFVMSKTSFTLYKFGKFCDLILNWLRFLIFGFVEAFSILIPGS